MKKLKYILFVFIVVLNGCSEKKITNQDIYTFINENKSFDSRPFTNYTIIIRQKTITETIYIVADNESSIDNIICFVYLNRFSKRIEKIKKNNSNLNAKRENEIKDIIIKYQKYDFPFLSVDKNGNFSVNPFLIDMKPYLLFMKKDQKTLRIKKNFTIFKHYKDNWYIRD